MLPQRDIQHSSQLNRKVGMIDKPDFSRDTGPGEPGIDNTHIPGRSYSSHQVEDTGCALCRREVGYWEHDGTVLYGTEGQRTQYVWALPPQQIPAKCTICDTCLEPFIARGDLEMYVNETGNLINELSKPATMALFTDSARTVINDFAAVKPMPMPASEFILPVTIEEIDQMMMFADRIGDLERVIFAGGHYALSALAFGKVLGDPNFDLAAEYYADYWRPAMYPQQDDDELDEEMLLRQLMESTNSGGDLPEQS
jgi:hypothetical protein